MTFFRAPGRMQERMYAMELFDLYTSECRGMIIHDTRPYFFVYDEGRKQC